MLLRFVTYIYIAGVCRTSNGSENVSSVQAMDRDQVEQMVTPCGGDVIDPAQIAKTSGLRSDEVAVLAFLKERPVYEDGGIERSNFETF
jgi:hypothetical protein